MVSVHQRGNKNCGGVCYLFWDFGKRQGITIRVAGFVGGSDRRAQKEVDGWVLVRARRRLPGRYAGRRAGAGSAQLLIRGI